MINITELPQCIREALAYHEAFRRLGFAAKDIYLVVDNRVLGVALYSQGREFVALCGKGGYGKEEAHKLWAHAAQVWKSCSEDERQALWNSSYIRNHSVEFVAAMVSKGFEWTSQDNTEGLSHEHQNRATTSYKA